MASAAGSDSLSRSIYEACIVGCDAEIERRPYHRNCSCALHDSRNKKCSHGCLRNRNLSYPIRRSWSEGSCLALMASSGSGNSSPSPSPSQARQARTRLGAAFKDDGGYEIATFLTSYRSFPAD